MQTRTILALIFVCLLLTSAGQCLAKAGPKAWDVKNVTQLLAAAVNVGKDGGTIRLAPGDYVIASPIVFKGITRVNIVGTGWDTSITMSGKGDALVFEDCGHCSVRDLCITGNKDAGSGIVFKGACGSDTVDFCRIALFPVSGIRFEGPKTGSQSSNTVSRCHFISNLQDQLYSFNNNDFYILQNQFGTHGGTPKTGARLEQSSAGTYSMNYHWDNEVALRLGPGSHYNRIENNRFEESRKEGIIIGSPEGWSCVFNIFIGNTIHSNSKSESGKYPAVTAYNAASTTFTSNQVFSWNAGTYKHTSSLVIGPGCRNWIVKDNMFHHNTDKALIHEEGLGHIVKDNITD